MDNNNNAIHPKSAAQRQWSTGLCDCSEDPKSCWLTAFFPCITFRRNVDILDQHTASNRSCFSFYRSCFKLIGMGAVCVYTCSYRTKLRAKYSLPKEPCGDFCVHFWCMFCAICQEYRELKNRGLDPSKGWAFYAQNMEGTSTKPPSVATGMVR